MHKNIIYTLGIIFIVALFLIGGWYVVHLLIKDFSVAFNKTEEPYSQVTMFKERHYDAFERI